MKNFTLILFMILAMNSYSQVKISPDYLIEDIDFAIRKYEKIHPNLYTYTNKESITLQVNRLKEEITDSLTSVDFWIKFAPIINSLKDGHTSLNPNYDDVGLHMQRFNSEGYLYLPFSVFIIDSVVYLREIYGNNPIFITAGSIIKSINGVSDADILKKLIGFKSGEKIDYRLHDVHKTFLWDYSLFYPSVNYRIEYIENGELKTTVLKGISDNGTNIYNEKVFPNLPDYEFKLIDQNIGFIEYNNCQNYEKFKTLLDSSFTVMRNKRVSNLIIDIRKNGGGDNGLNKLLLSYLYDKQFDSYKKIEVKISDEIRNLNEYYSQFPIDTIITLNSSNKRKVSNDIQFKGNVYLLTSIFTFSSGADCAMLFKDYNIGTIVGQETGGLPTSYGDTYSFKLPYSGLNADVSYKHFLRPSGIDNGKGVIPDIPIKYTIDDLLNEKDLEMEYVQNKIKDE